MAERTRGRRAQEFRDELRAIWAPQNAPCCICGASHIDYTAPRFTRDALEVDHIIPFSKRPDLEFDRANVRPSAFACNRARGNRDTPAGIGTTSETW